MEKKIKNTVKFAEEILNSNDTEKAKQNIKYFRQWLSYFQHERLIHLIVTITFSLITILCFFILYLKFNIILTLLALIFLVMSGAYLKHYYTLENKVQYLYELIDKLENL